ncbi:MAG: hypothetical protein H0W61_10620 [Bacteroidetes bacterium]|nr:hypothetical protein [Bacteroidota bacterium]
MKKIIITLITGCLIVLVSCYSSSKITGSWKSPKQTDKTYKTIFIAALTGNTVAKSTIENDLEAMLSKYGISTTKSLDEFPPSFSRDSVQKDVLMQRVRKKGSEAILTVSLLKKETESRYTSGNYSPMGRWGYYNNFGGYYNYWYPYAYSDTYYTKDEIYYLETNLYDSVSEELVWSAQSQTYSYNGLTSHSKEYSIMIGQQLKKDGILK